MKNNGHIVAEEFHPHRVKLTEATLKRLGVSIAECICADAAEFNPEFENAFDVVLVDAPCSGMGGGDKARCLSQSNGKQCLRISFPTAKNP